MFCSQRYGLWKDAEDITADYDKAELESSFSNSPAAEVQNIYSVLILTFSCCRGTKYI